MNPMYLVAAVVVALVVIVSLLVLLVADMQHQHGKDIKRHDEELRELRLKLIRHINSESDDGK